MQDEESKEYEKSKLYKYGYDANSEEEKPVTLAQIEQHTGKTTEDFSVQNIQSNKPLPFLLQSRSSVVSVRSGKFFKNWKQVVMEFQNEAIRIYSDEQKQAIAVQFPLKDILTVGKTSPFFFSLWNIHVWQQKQKKNLQNEITVSRFLQKNKLSRSVVPPTKKCKTGLPICC